MVINSIGLINAPIREAARVGAELPAVGEKVPASATGEDVSGEQEDSHKELEQAVEKIQQAVGIFNKHFKFRIHEETGRVIVQVVDNRTNEVVNEIPPEKILDMVADLQNLVGVIIDKKA